MKKFLFGAIAGAAVILMVMYCSTGERQSSTWKPYKKEVLTWQKLDTFVFTNPTFKVEYPNNFIPDSSQYDNGTMQFKYMFNGKPVILRCFSANNDERWDDNVAADFLHIEIEALNMLFIIRDGKRIIKAMIPKIYHKLIRYPNFRKYILIHQSVAYQLPYARLCRFARRTLRNIQAYK